MWPQLAILLTLCGLSAAFFDVTHVCKDLDVGSVVPSPVDCQSYFVCELVPAMRTCNDGLHFDAERKICNLPENANCKISEDNSPLSVGTPEIEETIVEKDDSAPPTIVIDSSTNTTPDMNWWSNKPRPIFMAVDVTSGQITNPMDKYDPKHIECRHFGAYFLPHPVNCRQYFICAYGHLHQHKCGRGTLWNYKQEECELSGEAECYGNASPAEYIESDEHTTATGISSTTTYLPTSTPISQSTVCYPLYTTGTTWQPTGSTFNPTGSTWIPTGSTFIPTGTTRNPTGTTWEYTGTTPEPTPHYSGATTTGTAATGTPGYSPTPQFTTDSTYTVGTVRALATELECDTSNYLSHPNDCSKYFICIMGKPVLTTCPEGFYWNQKAEFCDLARNVQCLQN